jgi:hypothetical protein
MEKNDEDKDYEQQIADFEQDGNQLYCPADED